IAEDERVAGGVHEAGTPLRAKTGAARADVSGDPLVVLHVLGDRDLPGLAGVDLRVDPLHHSPAVGDVRARVAVGSPDVADPAGRVPSQPVAIALLEPAQGIVADV